MIRDTQSLPMVKNFKPLVFWYECRFCKKEFRREKGFKITDKKACFGVGDNPLFESYCCNECAKSENEIKEFIDKEKTAFNLARPRFYK
ncbi:hypothetical protein UT300003_32850 [Clostridium sardiniense]